MALKTITKMRLLSSYVPPMMSHWGESAGAGDMNPHASILDSGDGEAQSVLTVTDLILGCTTPGWHASSAVYL